MKKHMALGILLSALAVYMVFETVRLYSLITRPDGTFITDADVAFGLYHLAQRAALPLRPVRRNGPAGAGRLALLLAGPAGQGARGLNRLSRKEHFHDPR